VPKTEPLGIGVADILQADAIPITQPTALFVHI